MRSLLNMKKIFILIIALLSAGLMSYGEGKRVLFIGDSITDGAWGNSDKWNATTEERNQTDLNHIYGHGYMLLCASYYQATYPDSSYIFWNRGISGNTLRDLHDRWQKDVIELRPDVVSILVGTNDVDQALWQNVELDIDGWDVEYRHILDSTKAVLPDVQFVICTPFVANVGRLKETTNYKQREDTIKKLASRLRQIAKDYNATLVPFDELFDSLLSSNSSLQDTYWIWDGIHPTPAGHYRMAELWKERTRNIMVVNRE